MKKLFNSQSSKREKGNKKDSLTTTYYETSNGYDGSQEKSNDILIKLKIKCESLEARRLTKETLQLEVISTLCLLMTLK